MAKNMDAETTPVQRAGGSGRGLLRWVWRSECQASPRRWHLESFVLGLISYGYYPLHPLLSSLPSGLTVLSVGPEVSRQLAESHSLHLALDLALSCVTLPENSLSLSSHCPKLPGTSEVGKVKKPHRKHTQDPWGRSPLCVLTPP